MDILALVNFLWKDSLFTFFIVFTGFVSGWALYQTVILNSIDLKYSLFSKDSFAGWLEFIGAFILPTLYLAGKAVQGSASSNILTDFLICIGYAFFYIVLFTALRLLSNTIVGRISPPDQQGRINLNNEIHGQGNTAASLFSISLSVILVCLVKHLDLSADRIAISAERIAVILVFTLIAAGVYSFALRRGTRLLKEIFVHNNTAAGISFLGFILAVEIILDGAVTIQAGFSLPDLVAVSAAALLIMGIFSLVFRVIFSRIVQVDMRSEIYGQGNSGAAFGQAVLYVVIANVVMNFIR